MDGIKSILASRTFWGALVAIAAGVLGIFGYSFGTEDQTQIVEYVAGFGGVVGGVIAVWGRIVASKKIG